MKKKILIVNNNMRIGGVQKALISLLHTIKDIYDVTLLLFDAEGELMNEIPEEVRVIETRSHYRYLGISQSDCKKVSDYLARAFYVGMTKFFGPKTVYGLLNKIGAKDPTASYDVVISYLHCAAPKSFYGGTAQYVLDYYPGAKKLCYIHCDYVSSGTVSEYSKSIYRKFDTIIGVSESVKERFLEVLPEMREKTEAALNPINAGSVRDLAQQEPYSYDSAYINCLSVARLSSEKGIDRFIRVLGSLKDDSVRYYVVGEGDYRPAIEEEIRKQGVENRVFLLGEQANPYRFMIGADLLIVPSFHEAAPVVFQEAQLLGLPILTTRTLSAEEMVPETAGFVVDNDECAMERKMREILCEVSVLDWKKGTVTNDAACTKDSVRQLVRILG